MYAEYIRQSLQYLLLLTGLSSAAAALENKIGDQQQGTPSAAPYTAITSVQDSEKSSRHLNLNDYSMAWRPAGGQVPPLQSFVPAVPESWQHCGR